MFHTMISVGIQQEKSIFTDIAWSYLFSQLTSCENREQQFPYFSDIFLVIILYHEL